ncbi:hypothetical protein [Pseudomonas siliginis]|uniref:hypothetical protein n=1 Tax=Pseudomonas siliginis TaxID=2842346 RepID=UPI0020928455|nr:hypothetical protein [Pseudomonas siliginis]UST77184.1 hypothetical protein NF676_00525 [Pseudomonas siliginis]
MVELPPTLPLVAACEIQAARDYSVPLRVLLARRVPVSEPVQRQAASNHENSIRAAYPIELHWAQQIESQFGIAPGTLAGDQCWGARATAYILRFDHSPEAVQNLGKNPHPFPSMPVLKVRYDDRSVDRKLSF